MCTMVYYYGDMMVQYFTGLKKRPIDSITISKYDANTEPLYKALHILKLPNLYNLLLYNF